MNADATETRREAPEITSDALPAQSVTLGSKVLSCWLTNQFENSIHAFGDRVPGILGRRVFQNDGHELNDNPQHDHLIPTPFVLDSNNGTTTVAGKYQAVQDDLHRAVIFLRN